MRSSLRSNDKLKAFIAYTAMFAVLFAVCFFVWILKARVSPIRRTDGLEQHFISYLLTGRILRNGFLEFFRTGRLHFQSYITSYGIGQEYLIATDPMYMLSMFIPERFAEYGFDIMIVLKCYLSGLVFMVFAGYRKRPLWACLAGAAVYTFSGSMYMVFQESSCVEFMYVFPLIMLGTIKLWEENKHGFLVFSLTIAFLTQFYFAYMASVAVLVYCIVRFLIELKERRITIRQGFGKAGRFALCAIFSIGMASVAYVPTLAKILTSERMSADYVIGFAYEPDFYQGFVSGFTSFFNMLGRDCYVGFAAIAVPLIALMYLTKGHRMLKTGFILSLLGLLNPYFGHIMNGMSYPSNRWVWIFDLCVGMIVTDMLIELKEISRDKKIIALAVSCLYSFTVVALNHFNDIGFDKPLYYSSAILTVLSGLAVYLGSVSGLKKAYPAILASVLCLGIVTPSFIAFNPDMSVGLLNGLIPRKTALHKIYEGGLGPVKDRFDLGDGERVETYNLYRVRNATSVVGVNSFDMYNNMCNSDVETMMRQIALHKQPWNGGYRHLDQRTELLALFGVNHVFIKSDEQVSRPYGYDIEGQTFNIDADKVTEYSSDRTYSIAYFMDRAISYDDYLTLSPEERQQVMLQAVILDSEYATDSLADLIIDDDELEYEIVDTEGIEITDDLTFNVTSDGGTVTLMIPEVNNCQIYTYFEGLEFDRGSEGEAELFVDTYDTSGERFTSENLYFLNGNLHMYSGIKDWIVNNNSITVPVNMIRICFAHEGVYKLTDLRIYARTFDEIDRNIARLDIAAGPDDIIFDSRTDSYSLDIDAPRDCYLMLALPYSVSWHAEIDGEDAKVYKSATGLTALYVTAGEHSVKITSSIFALKESAIVSIAVTAVYITVNLLSGERIRKLLKFFKRNRL